MVGIDSRAEDNVYKVYQYTGDEAKTVKSKFDTIEWAKKVERLGAGEIVLNCMNNDGMRQGYDLVQLQKVQEQISIPLIASGGAGKMADFREVFLETKISGALAASVFHSGNIAIPDLKTYLKEHKIEARLNT